MKGHSSVLQISSPDATKITGGLWGPVNKTVITGHESGVLNLIEVSSGRVIETVKGHRDQVTDLKMHPHIPMFISASKDHTAMLNSAYDLSSIRNFKTERPINSADISSIRDHVIVGGGQEASEVTTTAVAQGMFDARIFNYVYNEELGRVKGHFGPVNTVAFIPDGSGFATGGEDGFVRVQTFDPDYTAIDNRFK